jgi:hypothetical protein
LTSPRASGKEVLVTRTKHKNGGHFVVTYRDPVEGKVVSLRARAIEDSGLGLSFIRVSGIFFDSESLVIAPEEEALKKRLENVRSLHLSIYTILSIEEVGEANTGLKLSEGKSNLVVLHHPEKPK